MLICRGEVREFGLTGLTRNQVSLTAPGVRIPPSPPPSLACFPTLWRSNEVGAWGANSGSTLDYAMWPLSDFWRWRWLNRSARADIPPLQHGA